MRWCLVLFAVAGCSDQPDPPAEVSADAIAIAVAHGHVLVVEELVVGRTSNVLSVGSEVPHPTGSDGAIAPLDTPPAIDVAVGRRHACAISTTGTVHCWGDHTRGALGEHRACRPAGASGGAPDCVLGAELLPRLPPARAIAAGDDVTCAITNDHRVVCWGERGPKLGGSRLPAFDPPTAVALPGGELLAARSLRIRRGRVCAIDLQARLWCWGDGVGDAPLLQPQRGVIDVALGDRHSCVIDDAGLRCWGDNRNGQAGDVVAARLCGRKPTCAVAETPIELPARRVVVGERHTCALTEDGTVHCWGSNEYGQLGRSDAFLTGGIAPALGGARALAAGYARTCVLRVDGSAWCWGDALTDPSEELP